MTAAKTQIALGTGVLGAFTGFWHWHSPPANKLTPEEIDHYLEIISRLPAPGGKVERFITRLRPWAEADDGKPVYTLNLLRYHPELRRFPGSPAVPGKNGLLCAQLVAGPCPLNQGRNRRHVHKSVF